MKKINYFAIPAITVLIAVLGNYFTFLGLDSWYINLTKPDWTPSGSFIGRMWFFLYVLITLSVLWFYNRHQSSRRFNLIITLFAINAFLNVLWTYIFLV